jgi:hypothetical protein
MMQGRRRGGQPGNRNAVKTGYRTGAANAERAEWRARAIEARHLCRLAGIMVALKAGQSEIATNEYEGMIAYVESALAAYEARRTNSENATNEYAAAAPVPKKATNECQRANPLERARPLSPPRLRGETAGEAGRGGCETAPAARLPRMPIIGRPSGRDVVTGDVPPLAP